jgi:ABC-type glycerol-3-phosphate transport system substrate-binding protein
MKLKKKVMSLGLAAVMVTLLAACGSKGTETAVTDNTDVPSIDSIAVGEDYKDLKADIKILTNRTDIVDTVYKGYAEQFMELYPNIKVTYEGITDYEQTLNLRLTTGDWGDICFIPTSVSKKDLPKYFISLGDYNELDKIYNFCSEKSYSGKVYGIANGGTAGGIVYNKRIWNEAGITELPKTPDEFLEDLQIIKEKTDAVPLYTNFAAAWPMGQWDSYIYVAATGDPDFKNRIIAHAKDPFSKRADMTGPYAVYYTLYEAVARKLIEDDPASSDWESSKGLINKGEIATMVLGSWAVGQCKEAGENPQDIGYMPFPITVNSKQYAGSGGNYAFGINNKAPADNQIAAMLYMKWLIEDSSIYEDEGSIPALKGKPLPDALADFEGIELLPNNPARDGEEDLFEDVNNQSEVGLEKDNYPDCEILESALYGTKTLDELMEEWNAKWASAQETQGVEVNK